MTAVDHVVLGAVGLAIAQDQSPVQEFSGLQAASIAAAQNAWS